MFKYIGIRGHRGAGKKTISYLLGNAIETILKKTDWDAKWPHLIEDVESDNFEKNLNLNHVHFDSFADTLFVMIHTLLNIPMDWMTDDFMKDHVYINMKDFSYINCDKLDKTPSPLYTCKELFHERYNEIDTETRPRTFRTDTFLTLREFIYYFGFTMQSFFGLNTWVKSLDRNTGLLEKFYAGDRTIYKIFIDVKYPSEATYIKNNGGIIIKCMRPDNIKEDTPVSTELDYDSRVDYEISYENIRDLKDTIYNIANELIYG